MTPHRERKVLNVGCGPRSATSLHPAFLARGWREVRLDIDAQVDPDLIGDIVDLSAIAEDESYDAVWSSHNIEHLHTHQAPLALREFHRVLRRDGFALVTCPDVMAIAKLIVADRFEDTIYHAPAGPIGVPDMLWGHSAAISSGKLFMAHKTGYTAHSLGRLLMASGFAEAWVFSGANFDLWAVGLRERAIVDEVRAQLSRGGLKLPPSETEVA